MLVRIGRAGLLRSFANPAFEYTAHAYSLSVLRLWFGAWRVKSPPPREPPPASITTAIPSTRLKGFVGLVIGYEGQNVEQLRFSKSGVQPPQCTQPLRANFKPERLREQWECPDASVCRPVELADGQWQRGHPNAPGAWL